MIRLITLGEFRRISDQSQTVRLTREFCEQLRLCDYTKTIAKKFHFAS